MINIQEINMCLFVKHLFPHPAASKEFPCYLDELEKNKIIPSTEIFDKYISTIVILYNGNKWDSYEIVSTRSNVENLHPDEFGRYAKLVVQTLINKLIEIMKSKGIDITGSPISVKKVPHSLSLQVVRDTHLILPKHIN